MSEPLPEALAIFHAKVRLQHDLEIRYSDLGEDHYSIDIFDADGDQIATLTYDPAASLQFTFKDVRGDVRPLEEPLRTNDINELVQWMKELEKVVTIDY